MNSPTRFLVTGANGFLASWIVKLLLERGHLVRATVRSDPTSTRYAHLHALASAHPGKLELHAADLLDPVAFLPLAQDCGYVIHAASPFAIEGITDPQHQLVQPAVEGTRHVLAAASASPSVRRVVMTSSVAAIFGDAVDAPGGRAFTDQDWNTTSSLTHQPYPYSKTQAEKAAWEIAGQQARWELVVINPGFILGPSLSPELNGVSQTVMRNFANGTYRSAIADLWYGLVDVREVAEAHIRACLTPQASGRYILVNEPGSLWTMTLLLRELYGDRYPLPKRLAPKFVLWLLAPWLGFTRRVVSKNVGVPVAFDNRRSVRDLGLTYRPVRETLRDHFDAIVSNPENLRRKTH